MYPGFGDLNTIVAVTPPTIGPQIGMNPKPIMGLLDLEYWQIPTQTDSGSPRIGLGIAFFVFFFSHAQDWPFLTKQTTTQQQLQLSPLLMRGMRWGAPRLSRRALTPRRAGAHPAQVGARLRLDAPRQGGNGGGVGSAVGFGGGRGGGWLGNLPAPAGARRRRCSRWCRVDGGVIDACGGGCLFVPGGELNEMKKSEKNLFAIWPPTGNSNTTTNQKHTHAMQEVNVRRFDRWVARGERDSIVGGDQVGRGV